MRTLLPRPDLDAAIEARTAAHILLKSVYAGTNGTTPANSAT
ncbi:hypothetical protein [Prauserella endophytica]|nr:hypothetical protein [Prauserella endophytica]